MSNSKQIETGTIARWLGRGFGFITPDHGGRDVFLHVKALQRAGLGEPESGYRIRYVEEDDNGRTQARPIEYIS